MKKLVTISREYGSGGRIIGKLLAQKLGVPFYDKDERSAKIFWRLPVQGRQTIPYRNNIDGFSLMV